MDWKNAEKETPEKDGRFAVIYQQYGFVRRVFCDYSTEDGWLIGMPDVTIIAWTPFAEIPDWVIQKFNQEAA